METTNQPKKGGRKPNVKPEDSQDIIKSDPEDSWILCTNGNTNKLFPPALVNSKEFTKITKFKPVEINKL